MPKYKEFILLWLFSLVLLNKAGESNVCPRFCHCDLYMQLNRAQCSSKRLISAEVEVPKVVQILDLSYNDITTIERTSFKMYYHLKFLNLSHNAIQSLELDSFAPLKRIVDIDLSYNRLEYLDDHVFDRNHRLSKLNLEGNKFMSLSLKPLLRSTSLLELSLKNSQLNFIHNSLFEELPNLRELDLSQNLLNALRIEDFQRLKHLKKLILSENAITCDQSVQEKLKELKRWGMEVILDQCQEIGQLKISNNVEKFQKMTVVEDMGDRVNDLFKQWRLEVDTEDDLDEDNSDEISTEAARGFPQDPNEWLRFAPDAVLCEATKLELCQNYRKCLVTINNAWHEKRSFEAFNSSESKFSFILGAACGITVVILILTGALCVKSCCETRKKDHSVLLETHTGEVVTQPLARHQLPPQVRRQPRRRAPPRAVVRYEGPVTENFLSRLFGRPARQQYYRTINQNTATLIRRLSRSNLFNNRLSQHFTDRQSSVETNAGGELVMHAPSAPRPETPPPCYGDVVVNGCDNGSK